MTDARLPERWLFDRRLARLDDAAHRSFINALLWSVGNRTDGHIDREDLELIPRFSVGAAKVLVAAGLWTATDNGWQITDFLVTQTSSSELQVLENLRGRERRKKQRQREKQATDKSPDESDVPGDRPGGTSPGTAQAGRQAGRQGQEGKQQNNRNGLDVNGFELCDMCGEREAQGPGSWYPNLCKPCEDERQTEANAAFEEQYR
jgi:hypothetical protein